MVLVFSSRSVPRERRAVLTIFDSLSDLGRVVQWAKHNLETWSTFLAGVFRARYWGRLHSIE